jgi:TDG/mug DNA glycosylase family protein
MMSHAQGFAPIEDTAAIVLILGSMPGKASLAAGKYYAHPRNLFWPIMGELVGAHPHLPYEDRLRILKSSGIALWDVLKSCIRNGSLDSDIEETSVIPNDFNSFFLRHPNIAYLFFNGVKAEQCFRRHVQPLLKFQPLQYRRLPSTSPANAGTSYEKKLDVWRAVMPQAGVFQQPAKRVGCATRSGQ